MSGPLLNIDGYIFSDFVDLKVIAIIRTEGTLIKTSRESRKLFQDSFIEEL